MLKSEVKASIVCDPVYLSSSGAPLMEDEALEFYKKVIFPKTSLLTPNLPEAEKILGKNLYIKIDLHLKW